MNEKQNMLLCIYKHTAYDIKNVRPEGIEKYVCVCVCVFLIAT